MTTFPGSPRLLKGALVTIDPTSQRPSAIVFQYNPDTLTRTLQAQVVGNEGGRAGPMHFKGAPVETISLEVEIDATDQLEQGSKTAGKLGIYPQLAALELLLYPPSAHVIANQALLQMGMIEVIPPEAPLTLFIYGPRRILPVQVTEFRVTEEAHDPQLNPIRAKVSLGLRVLSYNDLLPNQPGNALFIAHQIVKEVLATAARTGSLDLTGIKNLKL